MNKALNLSYRVLFFMNRKSLLILSTLFLVNLIAWGVVYEMSFCNGMEVVFFDVGQGDATLIKTPEGHKILVDGGPGFIIKERIAKEIPFWERRIDLIILSHAHSDHLEGLIEVIDSYDVNWVIWNGVSEDDLLNQKWIDSISQIETTIAQGGQRIKGKSFYIDILYPLNRIEEASDLNETSIIARLVSNQGKFLFTGDTYAMNEKELVEMVDSCTQELKPSNVCRVMNLKSDVLKVAHHGSKTSTSREFLEAVSPTIAVISSGKGNSYGHPHKETLEILSDYGIEILRTDTEGNIKIVSDGLTFNQ